MKDLRHARPGRSLSNLWIGVGLFVVALSLRVAAARFGGLSAAEAHLWLSHPGAWGQVVHSLGLPSPFYVRMLSATAAALAAPLIFLVGSRLHSPAVGGWAGGLTALSYAAWYQESQMLPVGLVTLAVAYSAWFALRANDAPAPIGLWVLYAVSCLVMPLLEPAATFADLALLAIALAAPGARLWLALGAGAGLGAGVIAWHTMAWPSALAILDLPSRLVGLLLPLYLASWRNSLQGHTAWIPLVLRVFDLAAWGLAGLGVVTAAWRARLEGVFCAAWVVCAVLLNVPAAGLFYTVLALGLARLRAVPVLAVFMGFNLATAVAYPVDSYWWPGNWQAVAAFIAAAREAADGILPGSPEVEDALRFQHVELTGSNRLFFVTTGRQLIPDGWRVQQTHVVPGLNRGAEVVVYLLIRR
ncbi:MAG: hypothetical protein ACYCW6_09980 [Candidatus Xenobia bacterium]